MRNARWKIPEIADADVISKILPLRVDGCDAGAAVQHKGPFGSLVPMHFSNAASIQAHVHASEALGKTEFSHGSLTGPAAGCQPHMRVRERKAQIRKRTAIGGGWNEQIGILPVTGEVTRARIGAAASGAQRLRHRFTGLGAGSCRRRKNAASSRRRQ